MEFQPKADDVLGYFEACLREFTAGKDSRLSRLHGCIDYSLFAGGKRLRPLVCFGVGGLFGLPKEDLVSSACALEMIHTASLILDDLPYMDDGRLRRGRPANHLVYGQDVAALASVGLLNRAYEVILADERLPHSTRVRVVTTLTRVVGVEGMVGGQFADLGTPFAAGADARDGLAYVYAKKTSSIFEGAAEIPAVIADATADEARALRAFAGSLGFAFQALDDLNDSADEGSDENFSANGDKVNIVDVWGEGEAVALFVRRRDEAIAALEVFGTRGQALGALVRAVLGQGRPRQARPGASGAESRA